jgi:hypothetical protein
MLQKGTPAQVARVRQAFLQMKKFDIAALKQAFEARPPANATPERRVASRSAR